MNPTISQELICVVHVGHPYFVRKINFILVAVGQVFDEAIPGGVFMLPDQDGRRTEIVCAHCQAHLGHVFEGEQFTPKNIRH